MQTIKGRNIIVFTDFIFYNQPIVEGYEVEVEYNQRIDLTGGSRYDRIYVPNGYADYNVNVDDQFKINYYELINFYSYGTNNLVFDCEYTSLDNDDFEIIKKEISFKKLMTDSNYFLEPDDDFKYLKNRKSATTNGPSEIFATEIDYEYKDDETQIKMSSFTCEIDCRGSINPKDWNVLNTQCSFY